MGIGERHRDAGARGEDVLGVPVGSRDGGAACGQRERERTGGDLLAVPVRRQEDVGSGEQVGELVDRQEAVIERDVAFQAQIDHLALELQAVLLALATSDLRMGASRDHVQDLGVSLDDFRQRVQRSLQPFARREEPERREQEPGLHALVASVVGGHVDRSPPGSMLRPPCAEEGWGAVWHDPDLLRRAGSEVDQEAARSLGHDDHALGLLAQRNEHVELVRGGLGEQRVQRHDQRLRELSREGQDVLPVAAAVDPVLVLDQDDVDVEAAEEPRSSSVVAAHRLRDRGKHVCLLRAGRLVDHDEQPDVVDAGRLEQRGAHVGRKDADTAWTRGKRGQDRATQGRALSWRGGNPTRRHR